MRRVGGWVSHRDYLRLRVSQRRMCSGEWANMGDIIEANNPATHGTVWTHTWGTHSRHTLGAQTWGRHTHSGHHALEARARGTHSRRALGADILGRARHIEVAGVGRSPPGHRVRAFPQQEAPVALLFVELGGLAGCVVVRERFRSADPECMPSVCVCVSPECVPRVRAPSEGPCVQNTCPE